MRCVENINCLVAISNNETCLLAVDKPNEDWWELELSANKFNIFDIGIRMPIESSHGIYLWSGSVNVSDKDKLYVGYWKKANIDILKELQDGLGEWKMV